MTGYGSDMVARLKSLLPASWFSNGATPVLDTVLNGIAAPLAWAYSLYAYMLLQARIRTATGVWLDRIAYDFFGLRFGRRQGEADEGFRARLLAEILRERATRKGISTALTDLTGRTPQILELWSPGDCLAYDSNCGGYDTGAVYGSYDYPNQMMVRAYRPQGAQGIPNISGWDDTGGGYDAGADAYIDPAQTSGPVTDSDIYAAVAQTVAAGCVGWVQINS